MRASRKIMYFCFSSYYRKTYTYKKTNPVFWAAGCQTLSCGAPGVKAKFSVRGNRRVLDMGRCQGCVCGIILQVQVPRDPNNTWGSHITKDCRGPMRLCKPPS